MTVHTDRLSAALGRSYRIDRELGADGMATVFLAHDIKHDRDVAIEVRASRADAHSDLGGFARFADYYGKPHRRMVWCVGKEPKRLGGVDVFPWQQGLKTIGW